MNRIRNLNLSINFVRALRWLGALLGNISSSKGMIFSTGMIFAVVLRWSLVDYKTLDYFTTLKPWYNTISYNGFSAFSTDFSANSPPYLYLLYVIARLFPNLPTVIAVKLPAMITDFICGYFVFRIVQIKYKDSLLPLIAGMTALFAPTVVLNSAFWGQADSLFTAGILACVYFLMINKNGLAFSYFGIALAFKLQAIFLAPLLFVLFLRHKISWGYFLIVPVVFILSLVPAWLAGRPVIDLLNIYPYQISQFQLLTINAASIYSWLPTTNEYFNQLYIPALLSGTIAAYFLVTIVYKSPNELSKPVILELALLATLAIPFFLPKMRERYFFPVDIISIAFAFYNPRFFYIPFLVGGVSFLSYQTFLFKNELVPLPILALVLLSVISILLYQTLFHLYSSMNNVENNHKSDQLRNDKLSEHLNPPKPEI